MQHYNYNFKISFHIISFFKCLVTVLGTTSLRFEDEEAVRKSFLEQFGAYGDPFGLEDQNDKAP